GDQRRSSRCSLASFVSLVGALLVHRSSSRGLQPLRGEGKYSTDYSRLTDQNIGKDHSTLASSRRFIPVELWLPTSPATAVTLTSRPDSQVMSPRLPRLRRMPMDRIH